ncbi:AAA family ATPase [uncultured Merdimonas sp.]|uniref:ParA family protein n=1 Tax=uncultured Merdimonas sp. TaxID=2023269 RepID=UPI00320B3023
MKTIIFLNNKGGVGKTASVTTIAHMLAERYGKRVLLIDLDPQMNATCMFSEIDFVKLFAKVYHGESGCEEGKSVEDLLLDRNLDIHKCIKKTKYPNLDIICSYLTLSEAEERMKGDVKSPQQFRLKKHLKNVQNEYDYCIIDSSPSVSIVNINGLAAADQVYLPLRCDGGSLLGIAITMNLVHTVQEYNPDLQIGGMFFTQWNGRKNVAKTVYELLADAFGEYILPVNVGTSKNIEEGSLLQEPLLAYDNGKHPCTVTREYLEITEYIMEH